MIKLYYYSTLTDTFYEDKQQAEIAEDKFVDDFFAQIIETGKVKRKNLDKIRSKKLDTKQFDLDDTINTLK